MISFKLQLEPELLTRLREIAEHNDMSIACLIRHIITEWLAGRGSGRSNEPTAREGPKN
jgi:predicted DNA-binding ribbon-helix-helix protein